MLPKCVQLLPTKYTIVPNLPEGRYMYDAQNSEAFNINILLIGIFVIVLF